MADVNITTTQKVQLHAKADGAQGGDVTSQFSGNVQWSSDNPGIVSIANDADSLGALAVALGSPGTVNVSAVGTDARGKQWTASVSVEIAQAPEQVSNFRIVADAPVEQ